MKNLKRKGYYILAIIALFCIGFIAITKTYSVENNIIFEKLWNSIYKKITYVEIIGNEIVPTEDIVSMLYNVNIRDEFILKNKKQIIDCLKANQMIEDIMVKINFPTTLVIIIKERKPLLAYHTLQRDLKYVDVNFNEFETRYLNPNNFIYLRGTYNKEKVRHLITNIQQYQAIYDNLTEVENFAEYRFNIVLNNKLQVLLPEENFADILYILNSYIIKYDILNKNITKIDFRSAGKVYIAYSKNVTKYKPQPIKIIVYKKQSENQQYKDMLANVMTML